MRLVLTVFMKLCHVSLLQEGALDLLKELKAYKMTLKLLQVPISFLLNRNPKM